MERFAAEVIPRAVDELIMRLVDIALALPIVLVALVLVVTLGTLEIPLLPHKEVHLIASVLSLFIWVRFARQVRGEVLPSRPWTTSPWPG